MEKLDAKTVAWIFYAVDMAASSAGAPRTDILHAADAINHAVPLDKELNGSLALLVDAGLVVQTGKFCSLTKTGQAAISSARSSGNTVFAVWDTLTRQLTDMGLGSNNSFKPKPLRGSA